MVYVPSSTDYRRAVRATLVWAVVTPWIATCVALPFVLAAPLFLASSPWEQISIGGLVASLLASALGVCGLYCAFRCIVLSVGSVVRLRGYPQRHWWFLRRAFQSMVRTELVLFLVGAGATAGAIVAPARLAPSAQPLAALLVTVIVVKQLAIMMAPGDWLRHASIVPYFPRKVGEIDTFGQGVFLRDTWPSSTKSPGRSGSRPLSAFGWNDDLQGEPLVWHDSAIGLKTVNALIAFLEETDTTRIDDGSNSYEPPVHLVDPPATGERGCRYWRWATHCLFGLCAGGNWATVADGTVLLLLLIVWLMIPLAAMWTLALIPMRLLGPRPRFRRLARQPGLVAAGAASATFALIALVALVALLEAEMGASTAFDSVLDIAAYLVPMLVGWTVAVAWMTLLIGRRWRAESSWIDRLGRIAGVFWIVVGFAVTCVFFIDPLVKTNSFPGNGVPTAVIEPGGDGAEGPPDL